MRSIRSEYGVMSRAPRPTSRTSVEHFLSTSRQKLRRLQRRTCLRRSLLLGAVIGRAENLKRTQPGACIADDGIVRPPLTPVFVEPSWIEVSSPAYNGHSSHLCYTDSNSTQFLPQPVIVTVGAGVSDGEHEPYLLSDRADAVNGAHSDDSPEGTSSNNDEASGNCLSLEELKPLESVYAQSDSAAASVSPAKDEAEGYDRLPSFEEIFYYGIYGRPTCCGTQCSSSYCSGLTPL